MRFLCWLVLILIVGSAEAKVPPGTEWMTWQVEVCAPRVVEAGQEFPVIYKGKPGSGVMMQDTFEAKPRKGRVEQGHLTDRPIGGARQIRKAVIAIPGNYEATFRFQNDAKQIITAMAPIKVVTASEMKARYRGQEWSLPLKNVYLTSKPFPSWSQAPSEQREMFGMERLFHSPLLEQPDYDNTWWPTQSWNKLHAILQPQFVPPLALVRAFESPNPVSKKYVSYATWSQDGMNLVLQSEVGGSSWFYIEAPDTAQLPALDSLLQPAILKPSSSSPSVAVRSLVRFRAMTPDAPLEPVKIWLLKITPLADLNLRFPGYHAPELPRTR